MSETNINEFVRSVRTFDKKTVPEEAAKFQRALTLDALNRVVFRSPVDKGRFKGNWQVFTRKGAPVPEDPNLIDKQGGATIARESPKIRRIKPFSFSGVGNGVPYAVRLEDGHSKIQAPAGIVGPVIAELIVIAEQFGRLKA